MTEPTPKAPLIRAMLEELSQMAFSGSVVQSIHTNTCVRCKKPAMEFKDEVSRQEFAISGLCQECQDFIFMEG